MCNRDVYIILLFTFYLGDLGLLLSLSAYFCDSLDVEFINIL